MEHLFNSRVGLRQLSNFWDQPFSLRLKCGVFIFRNAEAAFQVCKARELTAELAREFAGLSAAEARNRGRKLSMRDDWVREGKREEAMRYVLMAKFSDPGLAQVLRRTAPDVLVHESPWDAYWGNGKDERGKNRLGAILMEIREGL